MCRLQEAQFNYHQRLFPLPHIDEALQAVHQSNCFTSFHLVQGYLQLAMAEEDIKKTAFRVGSSVLHEFTHMLLDYPTQI